MVNFYCLLGRKKRGAKSNENPEKSWGKPLGGADFFIDFLMSEADDIWSLRWLNKNIQTNTSRSKLNQRLENSELSEGIILTPFS